MRWIRPFRCSRRDGFHGRSRLMRLPSRCRFRPLRGGVGAEQQAHVARAHGVLQRVPPAALEDAPPHQPRAVGTGVDADGLIRELGGELPREPPDRVVVLAEDDAAALQPSLVDERPPDDGVLGILPAVGLQRAQQPLQHFALPLGQRGGTVLQLPVVLRLIEPPPTVQDLLHGPPPRLHGAAHAAQQQGAEEPRVAPRREQLAEGLGRLVRLLQERRKADGVGIGFTVQLHADRREVRLAGLRVGRGFEILARPPHDGAEVRVVALDQTVEPAIDALPVGRTEIVYGSARGVRRLVGQAERAAQDIEVPPLRTRRQGVAPPFPALVERLGPGDVAEHETERRLGVAPPAARSAEHRVRTAGQRVEQVVRLNGMDLHRRRRRQEQALRP